MLTMLRKRIDSDEDGFTLIELMVVVMIIAILMAIAIPTFLGAQTKAKDRAAQSDLRNALTAAKVISTDNAGLFFSTGTTVINAAAMGLAEPSLLFVDSPTAADTTHVEVGVVPASGADITLVRQTASGTKFFAISSTSSGVISKCYAATAAAVDTNSECAALVATATW
jgi:type IV pilus assembly protein PilA